MLRLLGLLILSSLIAYMGDKLGTRIGKRRLSIFGLRPKNTAILMTIITGMLIMLTTLFVTSLFEPNIRLAFTEDIKKIKESSQELKQMYESLVLQKENLEGKIQTLIKDTDLLSAEKERLSVLHTNTENAILSLRSEKEKLMQSLSQRLAEGEDLKKQLSVQTEQSKAMKKHLDEFEQEMKELEEKQKRLREEREHYEKLMGALREENTALISQLNSALNEKLTLKRAKEDLEASIQLELKAREDQKKLLVKSQEELSSLRDMKQKLETEVKQQLSEITRREETLQALKTEVKDLDSELDRLRQERETSQKMIATLNEILSAKAKQRLIVHSMEPLIDKPFQMDTLLTAQEFHQAFEGLLSEIALAMEKKGIQVSFLKKEKQEEFEKQIYSQVKSIWNEIEISHPWVENPSKGVLIYPVSVNNVVAGEEIREVQFIVLENKLLILKGKEIARAVVDSNLFAEELLARLFEMDDQLKKQMFSQGVLGNRFRSRTPAQIMQFARIVEEIKQENTRMFLSIVADDDIYSSGNFAFRYDLRREEDYLRLMEKLDKENHNQPSKKLRERLEDLNLLNSREKLSVTTAQE